MPWHVTVIPSYWPAVTLTKPFSAVCALPASLTFKTAKEIWGSSQMLLIHAFDKQAFTVCLLGSVKMRLGKEETHPLLEANYATEARWLSMRQRHLIPKW